MEKTDLRFLSDDIEYSLSGNLVPFFLLTRGQFWSFLSVDAETECGKVHLS